MSETRICLMTGLRTCSLVIPNLKYNFKIIYYFCLIGFAYVSHSLINIILEL